MRRKLICLMGLLIASLMFASCAKDRQVVKENTEEVIQKVSEVLEEEKNSDTEEEKKSDAEEEKNPDADIEINKEVIHKKMDNEGYNSSAVFTVNGQVMVEGRSDLRGIRYDLKLIEKESFDLYYHREKLGTYMPKVEPSFMEGEWVVKYDAYIFDEEDLYIGLPSKVKPVFYQYEKLVQSTSYRKYIVDYLVEHNISQTSFDDPIVYKLPQFTDEVSVIYCRDNQRDNVSVDNKYLNWEEEDYKKNNIGFFEVIYLVNETRGTSILLNGIVEQFTPNLGFPISDIVEFGEFNNKKGLDILIKVLSYDYIYYVVFESDWIVE